MWFYIVFIALSQLSRKRCRPRWLPSTRSYRGRSPPTCNARRRSVETWPSTPMPSNKDSSNTLIKFSLSTKIVVCESQDPAPVSRGCLSIEGTGRRRSDEAARPHVGGDPVDPVVPREAPHLSLFQSPECHQREHPGPRMGHRGTSRSPSKMLSA